MEVGEEGLGIRSFARDRDREDGLSDVEVEVICRRGACSCGKMRCFSEWTKGGHFYTSFQRWSAIRRIKQQTFNRRIIRRGSSGVNVACLRKTFRGG